MRRDFAPAMVIISLDEYNYLLEKAKTQIVVTESDDAARNLFFELRRKFILEFDVVANGIGIEYYEDIPSRCLIAFYPKEKKRDEA